MDLAPPSLSSFIIQSNENADNKMIDLAKMAILMSFKEYPNDFLEKCRFIQTKFEEKYGHKWDVSIIEDGDSLFFYDKYYLKIKYNDYIIKIMRTK